MALALCLALVLDTGSSLPRANSSTREVTVRFAGRFCCSIVYCSLCSLFERFSFVLLVLLQFCVVFFVENSDKKRVFVVCWYVFVHCSALRVKLKNMQLMTRSLLKLWSTFISLPAVFPEGKTNQKGSARFTGSVSGFTNVSSCVFSIAGTWLVANRRRRVWIPSRLQRASLPAPAAASLATRG